MQASLSELAQLVGGELIGDPGLIVDGAAPLADVQAGQVTFIDHVDKLPRLEATPAAAAIVPLDVTTSRVPLIRVADVHAAFRLVFVRFHPVPVAARMGISPAAHVSPSARLGPDVDVHPGATIAADVVIGAGSTIHSGAHLMAGCRLGENVTVYPNAVLYERTVVGPRCVIHASAVLGAHGFGYAQVEGRHVPAAQLGHVEIEADCEIGAGTTIDRGTYGATYIGTGTKIDNQVQIGHNCRIGQHNLLCSQVGIAGSTSTGDWVTMGGQVGVRDHIHIGRGAVIFAMSGLTNDVPESARMLGIPATPEREQKVKLAALSKLPELRKEIKRLTATVAGLVAQAGQSPSAATAGDEPTGSNTANPTDTLTGAPGAAAANPSTHPRAA